MSKEVAADMIHEEHHRDDIGSKMGMWIFLFTEVLLFGGLFVIYMSYRIMHSPEFHLAAKHLDIGIGTLNTIILLTSSLTMAISIAALQRGKKWLSVLFLCSTLGLALAFLVNKYFEWAAKYHHGLFPGSSVLAEKSDGEKLFFGLYYAMTGLHAVHIIIGMTILIFMFVYILCGSVSQDRFIKLENSGLYWHLVDLIWIFLFPLFYLLH